MDEHEVETQRLHDRRMEREASLVADAETLALIEEHELLIVRIRASNSWVARTFKTINETIYGFEPSSFECSAIGATIGDAVRACVARIREAK